MLSNAKTGSAHIYMLHLGMLKNLYPRQALCLGLIFAFLLNALGALPLVQAQSAYGRDLATGGEFHLPAPGKMVTLSPEFNPVQLNAAVRLARYTVTLVFGVIPIIQDHSPY